MNIRQPFYLLYTSLLQQQHARLLCVVFIFLLTAFNFAVLGQSLQKETVTIDLQEETLGNSTEITLDTDWEFYWNALLEPGNFNTKVPFTTVSLDSWTNFPLSDTENLPAFGYATYRLQFSLPEERPHISMYIPKAYAASKIWVNGKLFSEIGRVGKSKAETLHRRFAQTIPLDIHETNFEVVIQVANFYHNKGGISEPIVLGTTQHLQNKKTKRIITDMVFIGSLSFIGLFFLLFFLFYWNKDRAVLYFAILCLSLAYMALSDRYAPFAQIFESVSWILLTTIEYITLFLAGFSASMFFYHIFIKFVPELYKKITTYGFYALCLLAIFLPAPHFTRLVLPFLLLMILNILYATFIIFKAITRQRHESILLLTSMILTSFIFFAHIFIFLGSNGNGIIYVNFGYIIVFLLLSMLLMTRFSDSFKALEEAKVVALAQKKEISEKSQELSNVNLELKENVRQLKNYNAELDSFNHIVSHDLKAPLVAMHSLVSFIEEDLEVPVNKDAESHFNALKGRISKMYSLINGLLEYSRIAQGQKTKVTFSITNLLQEIADTIDPEKKHSIVLPKEDSDIHTSKIEFQHVFLNLMSNAIKHCDKENAQIVISYSKSSNKYIFTIQDNGPGIDPKYHDKVFEMFYQLEESDAAESTGIGLAIVKKIVSANHGKISIESKNSVGTTIKFSWIV
ncbi:sensor histidine kinase [uncultured Kordia sp.]|uniref:sensor histidine kinase n=1 Tax=uncultured Kordia sp. TaxID=507699 RepID=UPI00261C7225|nr:sensor histidine kinase [uncultured Kordia sp.]